MKGVCLFVLPLLVVMQTALAGQKIIQIGGGYNIDASQGQIEDNVIWLSQILKKSSDDVENFFAAGDGKGLVKDVSLYAVAVSDSGMEALARIFDSGDANRLIFKSNDVPEVVGSMRKDEIVNALSMRLKDIEKSQDILLIYNGHGNYGNEDIRLNSIKIWGDEQINIAEMDGILDHAPDDATVRFVFPQCYSGGFYYLIYSDPWSDKLASQNRCGFFAESPYDKSEGCSLSTNKDEYRDYSTYFFAPLNGATRNGDPLPVSADMDQDGAVSYRESHLYALMVGESKDLSRSTSEMYLESWVPWFVRWGYEENKESIYWKIAEYLSKVHGLSMDGKVLAQSKSRIQGAIASVIVEQEARLAEIENLASDIKNIIVLRWPEVLHPYTQSYINLINKERDEIADHIKGLSEYTQLVEAQDNLSRLSAEELELERAGAQIDKIVRMKQLAYLEKQFDRFADNHDKQAYQRLLGCENGTFYNP